MRMRKILVTIPLGLWVSWASAADGARYNVPPAGNSRASATDGFAANRPGTAGANEMNRGRDPRYLVPGQTVPPLDQPGVPPANSAAYRANVPPPFGVATGTNMSTGTGMNTSTTTSVGTGTATSIGTSTGTGTGTNTGDGSLPQGFRR